MLSNTNIYKDKTVSWPYFSFSLVANRLSGFCSYILNSFINSSTSNGKIPKAHKNDANEAKSKEGVIYIHDDMQINALRVFGINRSMGQTYEKATVNKLWRKLAIERHPDKNGGENKSFSELCNAKELLLSHSDAEQKHCGYVEKGSQLTEVHNHYKAACLNCQSQARTDLDEKISLFISTVSMLNKRDRPLIQQERDKFDHERRLIVSEFKMQRLKLLEIYLQGIRNSVLSKSFTIHHDLESQENKSIECEAIKLELHLDHEVVDADANAFIRSSPQELETQTEDQAGWDFQLASPTLRSDSLATNFLLFKQSPHGQAITESNELTHTQLNATNISSSSN